MSEVLERVIADQQKEIDRLRQNEKYNIEAWHRENKRVEALVSAAFSVMNYPEQKDGYTDLRNAVIGMGFCPICEGRPCECSDE